MSINAVLPLLKLSQHRYAAQLAARLRQHTPITTLVGILPAGRLHLGVGGRVLLVVIIICILVRDAGPRFRHTKEKAEMERAIAALKTNLEKTVNQSLVMNMVADFLGPRPKGL